MIGFISQVMHSSLTEFLLIGHRTIQVCSDTNFPQIPELFPQIFL